MRYRDLISEAATPDDVHRIKQEIERRHYVIAGIGAGEERNPDGLPDVISSDHWITTRRCP